MTAPCPICTKPCGPGVAGNKHGTHVWCLSIAGTKAAAAARAVARAALPPKPPPPCRGCGKALPARRTTGRGRPRRWHEECRRKVERAAQAASHRTRRAKMKADAAAAKRLATAKRDARLRAREALPLDGAAWEAYEARLAARVAEMRESGFRFGGGQ